METRANFVLIGAFTLAGIIGLVGMVLWFARVELDQRFAYYDVRFSSVSGLSEASDVRFAGLPVGQVVNVRLSPDRDGTVLVRLEVDAQTPVRSDSIATIESQGVTGVSFVGISAGRPDVKLLISTSDVPIPQIEAGRSVIQSLTEEAPALITEALSVVEEVSELLGTENQQRVENILRNAEEASESLAATLDAFAAVPATVERFAAQVEEFNKIIGDLSPEVAALLITAETTVGSLGALSDEASTMIVTANDTLAVAQGTFNEAQRYINEDLTDTTNTLDATVADLRNEITEISESARSMLATFEGAGSTANARLVEAETTLALASDTLSQLSETASTVDETATAFSTLLSTEGTPLLIETRAAVATATNAIDTIAAAAQNDLPVIVADIRKATQMASETIAQVAQDLSSASGRIDGLSLTAQTALTQATETFANANITLEAVNGAMATADETLIVAEAAFAGADRVINEDIDGIITGLEQSLTALNGAIAQVSGDIPQISAELRNASRSAAEAFGSLETAVDNAGPSIAEFTRVGLPLYTRLADEARGLIRNLDRLTQQIQRDPARFLLDQQSPEFRDEIDMMLAATLRRVVLLAILPVLAGCSAISALGDASTPLNVYDLRAPVQGPVVQGSPLGQNVIVELPTTSGVLDNDRILIRPNNIQAQYLPDARWGDEVPVMLQTLMVRVLENTNGLRYVGRRPLAGSGDFAIVTELVDFQAEVAPDGASSIVSISMTSRLVRESNASIVATRTFRVRQAAVSTETNALVEAFDRASQAILLEFADWTMSALGRRLATR